MPQRRARTQLARMFDSPKLISILGLLAIVSLLMSTWVVVQFAQDQAQRERERITSDVNSCERGNVLRGQVVAVGLAQDRLVSRIIDLSLADNDADSAAQFRDAIAPIFADYAAEVARIQQVDCQALTPGTKPGG